MISSSLSIFKILFWKIFCWQKFIFVAQYKHFYKLKRREIEKNKGEEKNRKVCSKKGEEKKRGSKMNK